MCKIFSHDARRRVSGGGGKVMDLCLLAVARLEERSFGNLEPEENR
jgi:hypothetical protein